MKKPLDSTLKGSVKYELPMIMSDGSMTLFATPGGSLFVKSQEKAMRPSRGGRLMVTPRSISCWQSA